MNINGFQESINSALKCSVSSIMDAHIEYNTPTLLAISVKAKGNQITFLDSDWSNEISYTYTKIEPVDPNKETLSSSYGLNVKFFPRPSLGWAVFSPREYHQDGKRSTEASSAKSQPRNTRVSSGQNRRASSGLRSDGH